MMVKRVLCFHFLIFSSLLLAPEVCSKKAHGNPAKELVDIINKNRTSLKLTALYDSPGLGCMALQYAEQCKGECTTNNTVSCHPSEDDFIEVFAADCGVELPTFSMISGVIVGCRSKYLNPSEAFSNVLYTDKKSLSTIRNKTHTEVGVGVASIHKRHFFWCVLFSSGQRNSSFVLENHGLGIKQRQGCSSGTNMTCSKANGIKGDVFFSGLVGFFTLLFLHLVLKVVYL